MAVDKIKYTSQAFWDFVNLPENADRFFERIDGEIVEYMPANLYSSAIAILIAHFLLKFILDYNIAGYVTGADGGYDVTDEDTFAPDAAYISQARQAQLSSKGFNPIPPDLAVEIVSPSDLKDPKQRIQRKLDKYLAAQIPLVWYVYTERQEVEVYARGQHLKTVGIDGALDGGDVLPGFSLPVRSIFPERSS